MISRGEHQNKDVGCKRTTVLHAFTAMHVWTEIAETEELRHFLFQGACNLNSC